MKLFTIQPTRPTRPDLPTDKPCGNNNGNTPCNSVPIDSGILILVALGVVLGINYIKKRKVRI